MRIGFLIVVMTGLGLMAVLGLMLMILVAFGHGQLLQARVRVHEDHLGNLRP